MSRKTHDKTHMVPEHRDLKIHRHAFEDKKHKPYSAFVIPIHYNTPTPDDISIVMIRDRNKCHYCDQTLIDGAVRGGKHLACGERVNTKDLTKQRWKFPGGGPDKADNLDPKATALRELTEETGLTALKIEQLKKIDKNGDGSHFWYLFAARVESISPDCLYAGIEVAEVDIFNVSGFVSMLQFGENGAIYSEEIIRAHLQGGKEFLELIPYIDRVFGP